MNKMETLVVVILSGILVVPLFVWVHRALMFCCIRSAYRFCMKKGLSPTRWRYRPALDDAGVTTEYTLMELDCEHPQDGRQIVRLQVWIFGVRKMLSITPFSENDIDATSKGIADEHCNPQQGNVQSPEGKRARYWD
jgi:hypothetical protein